MAPIVKPRIRMHQKRKQSRVNINVPPINIMREMKKDPFDKMFNNESIHSHIFDSSSDKENEKSSKGCSSLMTPEAVFSFGNRTQIQTKNTLKLGVYGSKKKKGKYAKSMSNRNNKIYKSYNNYTPKCPESLSFIQLKSPLLSSTPICQNENRSRLQTSFSTLNSKISEENICGANLALKFNQLALDSITKSFHSEEENVNESSVSECALLDKYNSSLAENTQSPDPLLDPNKGNESNLYKNELSALSEEQKDKKFSYEDDVTSIPTKVICDFSPIAISPGISLSFSRDKVIPESQHLNEIQNASLRKGQAQILSNGDDIKEPLTLYEKNEKTDEDYLSYSTKYETFYGFPSCLERESEMRYNKFKLLKERILDNCPNKSSNESCRKIEQILSTDSKEASVSDRRESEKESLQQNESMRDLSLPFVVFIEQTPLEPLPENQEDVDEPNTEPADELSNPRVTEENNMINSRNIFKKIPNRINNECSPTRRSCLTRPSVIPDLNIVFEEPDNDPSTLECSKIMHLEHFILPPGKKYRRSLSIIRHIGDGVPHLAFKGRNYETFVEETIELQTKNIEPNEKLQADTLGKTIASRRSSLIKQSTPPPRRRSRVSLVPSPPSPPSLLSKNVTTSLFKNSFESKKSLLDSSCDILKSFHHNESHESFNEPTTLDVRSINALPEDLTIKDVVFLLCDQESPCPFSDILDERSYLDSRKVGEGVFGEVFMISRETKKNVLKIIPIEGNLLVNGEKQKLYSEICSELLIAKLLHDLRGPKIENYRTSGYAELISSWIVYGKYPKHLLDLWQEFNETKGSYNDNPIIFDNSQHYLVLELGNAGTDLENYSFSTAKQALSVFKQTTFSLAVAEACYEFEHRDLHWGNVLISRTAVRQMDYIIEGQGYGVMTNGVKATIIDYTLSRLTYEHVLPIFNDVGKDPDMFIGTGDYQFDIYKLMKKDLNNKWSDFVPKTNVRWLHYLIDKMIKRVKYQRKSAKVHKDSMKCLKDIESWLLDCDNTIEIAVRIADSTCPAV